MIAFKRIQNDYTDRRLREVGFRIIYYDEITFRGGEPYVNGEKITDTHWYFRAVGKRFDVVNSLIRYGRSIGASMIDNYLLTDGPGIRSKWLHYTKLQEAGVPQANTVFYPNFTRVEFPITPCVLKSNTGGRRGLYTFMIRDSDDKARVRETVTNREDYNSVDREWLVCEYIPNNGDYRAMVVGNRCVGMYKRRPKNNVDMTMNTSDGNSRRYRNNRWPSDVANVAVFAAQSLGVTVAGIDLVRHSRTGQLYVVEVNEAPSFRVMEMRTKLDIAAEIANYVQYT